MNLWKKIFFFLLRIKWYFGGRIISHLYLKIFVLVESASPIVFSLSVIKDGCVIQARVLPRDYFLYWD